MTLASCAGTDKGSGSALGGNFRSGYVSARNQLESGDFDRAARRYETLMNRYEGTQVVPRLRLEYAHALLRAGRYDDASGQAQLLTRSEGGALKASALAIRGTAEHERARRKMDLGDYGAETRLALQTALSSIDQMLASHGELDPLDAMAKRRAAIRKDLDRIGRLQG